eukprot:TRINITY_DN15950_c0_g1_i1.p1 TRINITY_DN15950_c0_g1~~TRINITY_DN15950_c0_g1_i1.p1  ORF type:complete len:681 (+),score=158.97 TRINITY_DN15950_c0_g1_i1:105-2045(+)
MLEQLLIFTRGGLVLWTCRELGNALRGTPIEALIRTCLLEERAGASAFQYDAPGEGGSSYTLKWTFHNELGLVFVAVYQRFLHLLYVDELLSMVKGEFAAIYNPKLTRYSGFDETFRQLHREAQARAEELRRAKQDTQVLQNSKKVADAKRQSVGGHAKGVKGSSKNEKTCDDPDGDTNGKVRGLTNGAKGSALVDGKTTNKTASNGILELNGNGKPNGSSSSSDEDVGKPADDKAFNVGKLQKMRAAGKGGKKGTTADTSKGPKEEQGKKAKKNRVWNDAPAPTKLDFTDQADVKEGYAKIVPVADHGESLMDKDEYISESDDDKENEGDAKTVPAKKGWFTSVFQSVAGKSSLELTDLEPALKALKERLMTKNVAEEISEKLCDSVAASLIGKKLGTFTRLSSTVQAAMEEALLRILTPKRSVDILRNVHAAKEEGRPYVIVFVGVNGVGKSTNLAKVAYWLQQHDISVMMAACDTFRAGAVEQLRTHARSLKVPIFEKGYEKDPAVVAKEAIQEAARTKQDVVLVDTAGRMQDNEPLMRALSKLINLNEPDLVLFVGEALVGNDAVDQLTKFNQKLADFSTKANPRLIDGILLTKFDTIDDKVGAALSMVYISGAPVMFVGCGQTYKHLKKLNVKSIIKLLLQ